MSESENLKSLRRIGKRVSQDRSRRDSELKNEVEVLKEAGVSAAMMAAILAERGAESDEIEQLGLVALFDEPDPEPLILNTNCIGTCRKSTIELTIKVMCKKSVGN